MPNINCLLLFQDRLSKLASEQSKIAYILDTREILRLNSFRALLKIHISSQNVVVHKKCFLTTYQFIESCQHIKVMDKLGGERSG